MRMGEMVTLITIINDKLCDVRVKKGSEQLQEDIQNLGAILERELRSGEKHYDEMCLLWENRNPFLSNPMREKYRKGE